MSIIGLVSPGCTKCILEAIGDNVVPQVLELQYNIKVRFISEPQRHEINPHGTHVRLDSQLGTINNLEQLQLH